MIDKAADFRIMLDKIPEKQAIALEKNLRPGTCKIRVLIGCIQ